MEVLSLVEALKARQVSPAEPDGPRSAEVIVFPMAGRFSPATLQPGCANAAEDKAS